MLIRYCAPCNAGYAALYARAAKKCPNCEMPTIIVDSTSLLAEFGKRLDDGQRAIALKVATGEAA